MKLLKLQASFGRLDRTLTLKDGLNVLTLPNEAGKSTWSAFLLAMFYGIDTSERVKGNTLPVKLRYKPWSGAPMQGTLELEWNGRRITLERKTSGRIPMGDFRAYDTRTGQEIASLHADTCGLTLLGAERSVFERSAFLRQSALTLTQDPALEARLNALVTTGDDTNSYSVLSQQLRDLRNRCRHNQTGLIPQCQARLREVNEALQSLQHVQSDVMALAAQQQLLLSQRAQTQQLLLRVRRAEDARAARQLREADSGVQEKEARVTRLRETCALLPQPEVLSQLRRKSQALADAQHTAAMEAAVAPPVPSAPQPPAVFRGLTPAQASQHAAADRDTVVHLSAAKMPNRLLPLLLCGLLVLAAAGLFFVSLPAGLIGLGTAAVLSAVCLLLLGRKAAAVRAQKAQALEILARYQAASPDELTVQAAAFAEAMECYEAEKEDALLQKQHLSEALAQAQAAANAFFAEISAFAPGCGSFADADYALRAADAAYAALGSAERELQQARSSLAQLRAIAGQPEESGGAEEDLSLYDARELRMQLDRTEGELQSVTSRLNLNRGRVMAMGDTVMLTAERDALCERLAALNRYNDALTVASEALERANNDLQSRFSPRIAALAGQIFSQLTDGRYEKLLLDRSLNIQAMESGDPILHPAAALSCGTVDQLDLSVHLAMAELLLPKQCPWILDDALINFDDTRAQRAMALLCEKAKERQILLFTCHDREQRLLASASDREAAHD